MGKQIAIAGTERPQIKEVALLADGYMNERNKRMRLTKKEKDAKSALIVAMRKHGLTVYRDDDHSPPLLVTLSSKDDVKVEEVGGLGSDEGNDE